MVLVMTSHQILRVKEIIYEHRLRVAKYLTRIVNDITARAVTHDDSKLTADELGPYSEVVGEFDQHPYGTPGYDAAKQKIRPAIEHHYANNRHHPEHFECGVNDMNLVDILEMLCDWKSATQNHKETGTIEQSIQIGIEKYGISPQLAQIMRNTAKDYGLL